MVISNSDFHSSIPFFLKNYAGQKIRPAIMLNALIIANLLPKVNAAYLLSKSEVCGISITRIISDLYFPIRFYIFWIFQLSKFTLNSNPQLLDLVPDDSVRLHLKIELLPSPR